MKKCVHEVSRRGGIQGEEMQGGEVVSAQCSRDLQETGQESGGL